MLTRLQKTEKITWMPVVNPVLTRDYLSDELLPWSNEEELFVLRRQDINFEATIPEFGKLKSSGMFFLTNQRLVYVTESPGSRADFKSLEILLSEIAGVPKFEQPIFGANYLDIKTNSGARAYFTFYSGGAGTFLPVFYSLLGASEAKETTFTSPILRAVAEGRAGNLAFVDPNDPSVFYVTQPRAAIPPAE